MLTPFYAVTHTHTHTHTPVVAAYEAAKNKFLTEAQEREVERNVEVLRVLAAPEGEEVPNGLFGVGQAERAREVALRVARARLEGRGQADAADIVKAALKEGGGGADLTLMLAQLLIDKSDYKGAADIIEGIESISREPATIKTLMDLRAMAGEKDVSEGLLSRTLSEMGPGPEASSLRIAGAEHMIGRGKNEEAAEELRNVMDGGDLDEAATLRATALLAVATSRYDVDTAEQLANELPELEGSDEVDAAELEFAPLPRSAGRPTARR